MGWTFCMWSSAPPGPPKARKPSSTVEAPRPGPAKWRRAGHTVRVYVPYGPEWRGYSQRRLRKNPQILRHVMRNAVGLG